MLQADGEGRQLQQVILKEAIRLFSPLRPHLNQTCSTAEVMSEGGGRGEQRQNSEHEIGNLKESNLSPNLVEEDLPRAERRTRTAWY